MAPVMASSSNFEKKKKSSNAPNTNKINDAIHTLSITKFQKGMLKNRIRDKFDKSTPFIHRLN